MTVLIRNGYRLQGGRISFQLNIHVCVLSPSGKMILIEHIYHVSRVHIRDGAIPSIKAFPVHLQPKNFEKMKSSSGTECVNNYQCECGPT